MQLDTAKPFHVGPWLALPDRAELRGRDGATRLEPRTFDVLKALAAAGGDCVSRDALIERAWKGRVVSDDAVQKQIAKLRSACAAEPGAVETVPRLGFRLTLPVRPAEPVAAGPTRSFPWRPLAVAGLAAGVLGMILVSGPDRVAGDNRVLPLTSTPGREILPAVSPTGHAVAFSAETWGNGFDLAVIGTQSDQPVRLTDLPGHELWPAWSPDGERLAFVRLDAGGCEIHVMPAFGGRSERVAGCRDADSGLSWDPAGARLVFADDDGSGVARLHAVDLATGRSLALTRPPADSLGDGHPHFAPDGVRLAYVRHFALGVADLMVLEDGRERRVTFDGMKIHGFDWHPDGARLLVASNRDGGVFRLWTFDLRHARWSPVSLATPADRPSLSPDGTRLAFEQWSGEVGLWLQPLDGRPARPLVESTRWDWWPAVSPAGDRLAFVSDRSGAAEVWLAAADGSEPRRLSGHRGPYVQAPAWRPDGSRLVYAVPADGQFDLVELDPATGEARALTDSPEDEHSPAWSADGRHLYFVVQSGGDWSLHRLDTVNGERRPLREGVRRAMEDPSGRWLYFTEAARGGLWRMPVAGGDALRLAELAPVDERNWLVAPEGVYLVSRDASHDAALALLEPESGTLRPLAGLPELLYKSGLAATAEGIVYARETRREADLVLVENPPLD